MFMDVLSRKEKIQLHELIHVGVCELTSHITSKNSKHCKQYIN
jgi:hypothetical protein